MDIFTKQKRSEIMSKIRSKNTKIELFAFRELRKRKVYFQTHYSRCVGRPDIAIPSRKIAIFIDGDFWHGRNFSKNKLRLPKKYWLNKIEANISRDKRNRARLRKEGWEIMRVWETDLAKNPTKYVDKMTAFLLKNKK